MIRALVVAFAFLTRFPFPPATAARPTTDVDLGRSIAFFPLVGLTLGLAVAGMAYALVGLLPSLLIAVAVVAMLALLTGGLHLDGVADLFDGLGGGRGDRERILAIMRDSHIGAHGAVALILLLLAKVVAVAALIDARNFPALVVFPVLGRWAVTPQMVFFPYARSEGLGRGFKNHAGWLPLLGATVTASAVAVALGAGTMKPAAVALGCSLLIALALRPRLNGLTGDVYGATIEICETAALFAAAVR